MGWGLEVVATMWANHWRGEERAVVVFFSPFLARLWFPNFLPNIGKKMLFTLASGIQQGHNLI